MKWNNNKNEKKKIHSNQNGFIVESIYTIYLLECMDVQEIHSIWVNFRFEQTGMSLNW